jgi:hypothetical protein
VEHYFRNYEDGRKFLSKGGHCLTSVKRKKKNQNFESENGQVLEMSSIVAIHCALIYGDKSSTLFVGALADTSI